MNQDKKVNSVDDIQQDATEIMTTILRPVRIPVIAWITLVRSWLGFFSVPVCVGVLWEEAVYYGELVKGKAVFLVFLMLAELLTYVSCAIGFLRGRNWARQVYAWAVPCLLGLILLIHQFFLPALLFPSILLYLITLTILFSPKARSFFIAMRKLSLVSPTPTKSASYRKNWGVVLAFLSGAIISVSTFTPIFAAYSSAIEISVTIGGGIGGLLLTLALSFLVVPVSSSPSRC
jgi:hypothetical protein